MLFRSQFVFHRCKKRRRVSLRTRTSHQNADIQKSSLLACWFPVIRSSDAFNGPILPFSVGRFNGRRGTCTLFSWVLWGFFAIYLALPASLWYSIMADLISKAASIKGALQQGAERGDRGDVPKWFKGPHSKCGRPGDRCVGSNPTISATKRHLRSRSRRCFCVF